MTILPNNSLPAIASLADLKMNKASSTTVPAFKAIVAIPNAYSPLSELG